MSVRIVRPGLLTTVQDLGRYGWQRHGVVVGGAMDALAMRIANLLVGNAENAAGLECTLLGPAIEFQQDRLFALTGADLGAQLNNESIPTYRPCLARAGSVLSFTGARAGCRANLAFAGGIDVPQVLGSRSTDLRAGIGGLDGRALRSADVLTLGAPASSAVRWADELRARNRVVAEWGAGYELRMHWSAQPVVRVMRGLEYDSFSAESLRALWDVAFCVSRNSDRMGYRLEGQALALERPLELLSTPVVLGTVQVPPGGDPIVLMADRASMGGYPRIAQVSTVDLPLLAQSAPGTRVRFREVSLQEAQQLYLAREEHVSEFAMAIRMRGTREV